MEVKWNKDPQSVIKELQKEIDNRTHNIIDSAGNNIEKATRRNFSNAVNEIPADNPLIRVYSYPTFKISGRWSKTIECMGEQVLFVEFGAGKTHSTETSTVGTENNQQIERATRPYGIVGIGEWGSGRGKDDVWFYKSRNRRESLHSHFAKVNRRGEFIMITSGIRPIRALWRAVGSTLRQISKIGGKGGLKIK